MSSDAEIQAAWEQAREWVEKFGAEPVFILNHANDSGLTEEAEASQASPLQALTAIERVMHQNPAV